MIPLLFMGDDDGSWRRRLETLGHRVFPAASAAIAANLLDACGFDLVVVAREELADAVRGAAPTPPVLVPAAGDDDAGLAAAIARLCRWHHDQVPAELQALLGAEQMSQLWALLADSLRQAVTELDRHPDCEDYADLAHRLKGSAATMGLERLYRAADAKDSPAARQALAAALGEALMDCEARLRTPAGA